MLLDSVLWRLSACLRLQGYTSCSYTSRLLTSSCTRCTSRVPSQDNDRASEHKHPTVASLRSSFLSFIRRNDVIKAQIFRQKLTKADKDRCVADTLHATLCRSKGEEVCF